MVSREPASRSAEISRDLREAHGIQFTTDQAQQRRLDLCIRELRAAATNER